MPAHSAGLLHIPRARRYAAYHVSSCDCIPPRCENRARALRGRPGQRRRNIRKTRFAAGCASAILALLLALCLPAAAGARTLEVGPGKRFAAPSAAIAQAQAGDRIVVAPGRYTDCAVLARDNLVLEGSRTPGAVVITGRICQGKALLVTQGRGIVLRDITLADARIPQGNAAGIRAEGGDLTVERVRFIGNQDGILSANNEHATLRVLDSLFDGNGACDGACAHGIYAGRLGLLRVERSVFRDTRHAHHIKSRALATEVVDCTLDDGPEGTASYMIETPNGGALLVQGSTLVKGRLSENHAAAIMIGIEGVSLPTPPARIDNNRFRNDGDYDTYFVQNYAIPGALLRGNTLSGRAQALWGTGSVE